MSIHLSRVIDNRFYPKKAVAEAKIAYRECCEYSIEPLTGQKAQLSVLVKDKFLNTERDVLLGFWNYLLDRACQIILEEN